MPRTSIHLHYASDGACSFHRMLQPARFCCDELESKGIELSLSTEFRSDVDWLGFHGLPPSTGHYFELARIKRQGTRILWSVDDDWTTIPDWNPAKPTEDGLVVFQEMRRLADAVICSTPCLADTFHGKTVLIAPNLLDLTTFPVSPYDNSSGFAEITVDKPIRIVWSGGRTHKGDVEVIGDALNMILNKYGRSGQAAVVFMGDGECIPPALLRDWLHRGLLWQQPVPFAQYRKFANSINPHIWIAPLTDIPFNYSKSCLRVMEGWALGSAVVASSVGEYNRIRTGVDGILVADADSETRTDRWFTVLDHLVQDHGSRTQLAANGRIRALAECDWNVRANRLPWLDAYRHLTEL